MILDCEFMFQDSVYCFNAPKSIDIFVLVGSYVGETQTGKSVLAVVEV